MRVVVVVVVVLCMGVYHRLVLTGRRPAGSDTAAVLPAGLVVMHVRRLVWRRCQLGAEALLLLLLLPVFRFLFSPFLFLFLFAFRFSFLFSLVVIVVTVVVSVV